MPGECLGFISFLNGSDKDIAERFSVTMFGLSDREWKSATASVRAGINQGIMGNLLDTEAAMLFKREVYDPCSGLGQEEYLRETVAWIDRYLRTPGGANVSTRALLRSLRAFLSGEMDGDAVAGTSTLSWAQISVARTPEKHGCRRLLTGSVLLHGRGWGRQPSCSMPRELGSMGGGLQAPPARPGRWALILLRDLSAFIRFLGKEKTAHGEQLDAFRWDEAVRGRNRPSRCDGSIGPRGANADGGTSPTPDRPPGRPLPASGGHRAEFDMEEVAKSRAYAGPLLRDLGQAIEQAGGKARMPSSGRGRDRNYAGEDRRRPGLEVDGSVGEGSRGAASS